MAGISIASRRNHIATILDMLTSEYGPFEEPRKLLPADELVFTILSQHTSDINSGRAYNNLMSHFGTLEHVAAASTQDIEKQIQRGGLAKVKAPRIKSVLNQIIELNGSLDLQFLKNLPVSEGVQWLTQLKGIGPKSAGIVLNFSLGLPAMAIDTHIYRVSQRLRIIPKSQNVDKAHVFLQKIVLPEQITNFHTAIITHGRQTCSAQNPKCSNCVVAQLCPSKTAFLKNHSKNNSNSDKLTRNRKRIVPHSPEIPEENV
ncbi:MAG: DNA lyase [Dehalococcoidia bacterium]|jgi:endonuclease-3|nr:DNA lyase [Dehalococcoidia bacterium]MQG07657.1 endonuclease III [SAR202 cluster bacterium]CAI8278769.1 MAG: Endonuclease III [Chloroflexota bacterium]MCH2529337.1 endonuclease III [Dehalococcoidia bacterium]MQG25420.1 endonuclease III [SAR202 cluster bacterium]|tara:strand:- start:1434 stop:2210 length:777 start_codon:yes stop_codon:yes gene_type:complete